MYWFLDQELYWQWSIAVVILDGHVSIGWKIGRAQKASLVHVLCVSLVMVHEGFAKSYRDIAGQFLACNSKMCLLVNSVLLKVQTLYGHAGMRRPIEKQWHMASASLAIPRSSCLCLMSPQFNSKTKIL